MDRKKANQRLSSVPFSTFLVVGRILRRLDLVEDQEGGTIKYEEEDYLGQTRRRRQGDEKEFPAPMAQIKKEAK